MDMVLVRTTVATEAQAADLAQRMVRAGLAACVHRSAVTSVYKWEGEVVEAPEWLVEARTLANLRNPAIAEIERSHPYKVPLVETLEAGTVPPAYGAWARSVVRPT